MAVRPMRPSDYEGVNRLYRSVGWPERSYAGWRWLEDNPARVETGAPMGWVVVDDADARLSSSLDVLFLGLRELRRRVVRARLRGHDAPMPAREAATLGTSTKRRHRTFVRRAVRVVRAMLLLSGGASCSAPASAPTVVDETDAQTAEAAPVNHDPPSCEDDEDSVTCAPGKVCEVSRDDGVRRADLRLICYHRSGFVQADETGNVFHRARDRAAAAECETDD